MTTDLAAPPQTRPPHINPRWWYRATWHARQQAINEHNKTTRANEPHINRDAIADAARIAEARTLTPAELDTAALTETLELLLTDGATPDKIIEATGRRIGALEARMRRAGRPDLARQLGVIRNAMRRTACPVCGKAIWPPAVHCQGCANLTTHQKRRQAVIEDAEWMLSEEPTVTMAQAASRLGYSSENGLDRMLLRAGRDDLIERFAANAAARGARVTTRRSA